MHGCEICEGENVLTREKERGGGTREREREASIVNLFEMHLCSFDKLKLLNSRIAVYFLDPAREQYDH